MSHLLIQIFNLHLIKSTLQQVDRKRGGLVAWSSRCPNLPEMSLDCFWVCKMVLASKSFWASFAMWCDPYGGYELTKACAALRRGFFPVREVEHELTNEFVVVWKTMMTTVDSRINAHTIGTWVCGGSVGWGQWWQILRKFETKTRGGSCVSIAQCSFEEFVDL